ncbi:hypothetical protein SMICM304S_03640 [Streptomyces microflavus]
MSHRPPSALAAVSAALLAMSRHLEVGDVLKTIVASARELLDAQYAALGVPDDHGGFAQFVVDGVSDEQWKAIGPLPRQHGILAAMLHQAKPERLADVRKDPRFGGWPDAHPDMSDFLGLPITDGDEIIGALFLANKQCPKPDGGCGFTAEDEELLSILAQHAAIALTNARLYERSRELTIAEERSHGLLQPARSPASSSPRRRGQRYGPGEHPDERGRAGGLTRRPHRRRGHPLPGRRQRQPGPGPGPRPGERGRQHGQRDRPAQPGLREPRPEPLTPGPKAGRPHVPRARPAFPVPSPHPDSPSPSPPARPPPARPAFEDGPLAKGPSHRNRPPAQGHPTSARPAPEDKGPRAYRRTSPPSTYAL